MKDLSKEQIQDMVSDALSDIYLQIQQELGVETGDVASHFHSGEGDELEETMVSHFEDYIQREVDHYEQDENRIEREEWDARLEAKEREVDHYIEQRKEAKLGL
jgi:hypothetical protein